MGTTLSGASAVLAAIAAAALWSPAAAQSTGPTAGPAKACTLLTDAEVEKLINRGRQAYGAPEGRPLGPGESVCEYPIGAQVLLFSGAKSQANFEAFLKSFRKDKEPRHPVSGVGDRAYIMFPTPRDQYEDRLAYLVTTVGPHTVAVSMAAKQPGANALMKEYCKSGQLSKEECAKIEEEKEETPQSLQPAVEAVAKTVVAKLR